MRLMFSPGTGIATKFGVHGILRAMADGGSGGLISAMRQGDKAVVGSAHDHNGATDVNTEDTNAAITGREPYA